MQLRTILTLAAALILASAALFAHHSFTMFDTTREVTITGTVREFQWTNPHTFAWIDVPNASGGVDTYGIEGMSPNFLGRRGWTKNTLKPGDKVTVVMYPLKDGQKGGTFLRCILADGRVMMMFGAGANEK